MTDNSEIAANLDDAELDTELWLHVLDAPGTAPLVGRVRGLATTPSALAISGARGVGKRALASLVHTWSERPGEFIVVDCPRLVSKREARPARADALVDEWFRSAAGGTLVLVDAGVLERELQLAIAARLPDVHSGPFEHWSEPPPALPGPRTEARVVLVLEAGGLDWLELDLRRQIAQHTELPPLVAHGSDVAVVVRTLLEVLARRDGAGPRRVTAEGLEYLQRCAWPTQLAGLMCTVIAARASVARSTARGTDAEIDRAALALAHATSLSRPAAIFVEEALEASYRDAKESVIEQFEGLFFARVLDRTQGNVSEAARQTGLDRSNFRRALRRARERAGSAHPHPRASSPADLGLGNGAAGFLAPASENPNSLATASLGGESPADSSRRYDSATHRIESGVRWQAADGAPNLDRAHSDVQEPVAPQESGEVLRPGVASVRPEGTAPARLHGSHPRR